MINSYFKLEIFFYKILYFISFIIFVILVYFNSKDLTLIFEFNIFSFNSVSISFPILLDWVSLAFSGVILFIRGSVVFFANYYMEGEKFINRFISLILLFILSINFLIFVPNIITILLGWDGLGIVSFLLVIYYQNSKSLGAGLITIISNRVGDSLLIVSIGWLLRKGSWNAFFDWGFSELLVVCWCVTVAGMTKSAQIPFSAWLPAAIAAPTPVSALVHSSTLVTAGVYLMVRFRNFILNDPNLSWFLLCIGTLTTLIAGISAIFEIDLKKVIALSTLSQLGVMIFSLRLGIVNLAVLHLFTHAIFKALLFMCAGSIIHSHHHSQDIRKVGITWFFIPISTSSLNIANLCLCGFPFLSGFYSKDLILETIVDTKISAVMIVLMLVATLLTTAYSARLTFIAVLNTNNFSPMRRKLEETSSNTTPIVIITFIAIMTGSYLSWMVNRDVAEPYLTLTEKLFPIIMLVISFSMIMVLNQVSFQKKMMNLISFGCSYIWFIAPISSQPVLKRFFYSSTNNIKVIDQGWNEVLGGQGMFLLLKSGFYKGIIIQFNKISTFLLIMAFNSFILIVLLYSDSSRLECSIEAAKVVILPLNNNAGFLVFSPKGVHPYKGPIE